MFHVVINLFTILLEFYSKVQVAIIFSWAFCLFVWLVGWLVWFLVLEQCSSNLNVQAHHLETFLKIKILGQYRVGLIGITRLSQVSKCCWCCWPMDNNSSRKILGHLDFERSNEQEVISHQPLDGQWGQALCS